MEDKKKLVLYTSDHIIDTKRIGYSFLMGFEESFDEHRDCINKWGYAWQTDREDTIYVNLGTSELNCAFPIVGGDKENNQHVVDDVLPEKCSLLCTTENSKKIIERFEGQNIEIFVLHSDTPLATSQL
jgi:hypothetical protein